MIFIPLFFCSLLKSDDYQVSPPKKRNKTNLTPQKYEPFYHHGSSKRRKAPEATVVHGNRMKSYYGDELKLVAMDKGPSRCSSAHSVIIIPDGDDDNIITTQNV